MQKLIWQNSNGESVDLTQAPYGITNWEGFSNTSLNIQSQQVPFQDGGVFLDALIEQRELSVTLAMQDNNNLEERYRMRRELIHILNPKLGEGYLIYKNDFTEKRIKCVAQIPLFETHNSNDSGTPKASLAWTACEPYWEDLEETEIVLQNGIINKIQNNGDVETNIKLNIYGNDVKDPIIANLTKIKNIQIEGIVNDAVINTEIGEKSVFSKKLNYKYLQGGVIYGIATDGNINVYVGDVILVEDKEGVFHKINSPATERLLSVTYGNGIFVAVSQSEIIISTDGFDWSLQESGISGLYYGVKYGNGIFVAVGSVILVSSDGYNWTDKTGTFTYISSFSFANDLFLIVNDNKIYSSEDCETFAEVSLEGQGKGFIVFNTKDEKYYAVDYAGIVSSTDLITWQSVLYDIDRQIEKLYFLNGVLVALYNNGIYKSTDGENWNYTTLEGILTCAIYVNNRFIIANYYGGIFESNNLSFWNILCYGIDTNTGIKSIAYGNGIYVMPTENGIYTSNDGMFFVKTADYTGYSVTFNEGYFCIASSLLSVLFSTDGLHWTKKEAGEYNNPFNSAIYHNGVIVAVGLAWAYATNDFGETWEHITINDISINGNQVIVADNKFVVVGGSGDIYFSTNGFDWTFTDLEQAGNSLNSVAYGNRLFVAVGSKIIISTDLINWTQVETEINESLNSVVFAEYKFITTGENGLYLESVNGMNWTEIDVNATYSIYINYVNGRYYLLSYIVEVSEFLQDENIISKLSKDSDMNLGLTVGQNEIRFDFKEGSAVAKLNYRQKYIGV